MDDFAENASSQEAQPSGSLGHLAPTVYPSVSDNPALGRLIYHCAIEASNHSEGTFGPNTNPTTIETDGFLPPRSAPPDLVGQDPQSLSTNSSPISNARLAPSPNIISPAPICRNVTFGTHTPAPTTTPAPPPHHVFPGYGLPPMGVPLHPQILGPQPQH